LRWAYSGQWKNLPTDKKKLKYFYTGIWWQPTFLKEKIQEKNWEYKFKDGESQETIKFFSESTCKEFLENHFKYIHGDIYEEVHKKIKLLIHKIRRKNWKQKINSEYFLKYLESKVKRYIQEQKGKEEKDREAMNLKSEILDGILKSEEDITTELMWDTYYYDVFLSVFTKKFLNVISDIKNNSDLFWYIQKELWDEYDDFIDSFKETISKNIFSNKSSLEEFIININTYENMNYKDSDDKHKSLNDLLSQWTDFLGSDNIKNKIRLLLHLYYLKKCHEFICEKDTYFNKLTDSKIYIEKNWVKSILTWSSNLLWSDKKSNIKKMLNTNLDILYERDFIWVIDSVWSISWFLNIDQKIDEEKFFNENPEIKNSMNKLGMEITKIKNIKIYCWMCHSSHKDKMLWDECWIDSKCNYKLTI